MENEWITMFRRMHQSRPFAVPSLNRLASPVILPEKVEDRQTIEIFRAVLRKLFGLGYDADPELQKPFLFILYSRTGASAETDCRREGQPDFNEIIRRGVTRGSKDFPLQIVWIEDCYGVGGDPNGEYVPSGGAVIRFTGIRRDGADIAVVDGNIHLAGSEPRGFEHIVEKRSGFWMVRSSYHQWIG